MIDECSVAAAVTQTGEAEAAKQRKQRSADFYSRIGQNDDQFNVISARERGDSCARMLPDQRALYIKEGKSSEHRLNERLVDDDDDDGQPVVQLETGR